MLQKPLMDEFRERLGEAIRKSPAAELEHNLRALMLAFFDRMDLVTREDFEIQKALLEQARSRLAALEARLAEIESDAARGPHT